MPSFVRSYFSDIKKYKQTIAEFKLRYALEEGERSARLKGWMMVADVRKKYEV